MKVDTWLSKRSEFFMLRTMLGTLSHAYMGASANMSLTEVFSSESDYSLSSPFPVLGHELLLGCDPMSRAQSGASVKFQT